jgi:hypothetical protein
VAVILTAIEPEYLAVRAHLPARLTRVESRGTLFEVGTFHGSAGTWTAALTQTGHSGGSAAAYFERARRPPVARSGSHGRRPTRPRTPSSC